MILGPTYKCQNAIDAVNRVKATTKRKVITFEDIIPPISDELKDKKWYMKQEEFWNNHHNARMYKKGVELSEVVTKIIKKYGY